MEYAVQENKTAMSLPSKKPELVEALAQFKNQNDYTDDVSSSIKEKLRNISKWEKVSDRPMDKIPEMIVNSAIDEFNYQLRRQRELNERLSDILLHLKEVV